jgi:hypothetical protein
MTTDFRYDGKPQIFLYGVKCVLIRRLECCGKRLAGSSFRYVRSSVRIEPPGFHQADDDGLLSGRVLLSSIENIQVLLKSRESETLTARPI